MSSGLPIICSRKAALKDVISNGNNGFLLDDKLEPSELSTAIITLLEDSKKSEEISEQNILDSAQYDIDSVCNKIKLRLESII